MEESSLIATELIYILDFLKMLWGGEIFLTPLTH